MLRDRCRFILICCTLSNELFLFFHLHFKHSDVSSSSCFSFILCGLKLLCYKSVLLINQRQAEQVAATAASHHDKNHDRHTYVSLPVVSI